MYMFQACVLVQPENGVFKFFRQILITSIENSMFKNNII